MSFGTEDAALDTESTKQGTCVHVGRLSLTSDLMMSHVTDTGLAEVLHEKAASVPVVFCTSGQVMMSRRRAAYVSIATQTVDHSTCPSNRPDNMDFMSAC